MPPRREAARKAAVAAIDELRVSLPLNATAHCARARQAQALAKDAGDLVLEAEALLLMGRTFTPSVDPWLVWGSLLRAQQIFDANRLEHKGLTCRIAAAQVLFDIGEERNAIAAVETVIDHPKLSSEDRSFGQILIALCYSHLGELDIALRRLRAIAFDLASSFRDTPLLSHVLWALGLTYIRVLLFRRNPELFRGWSGMPPITEPTPAPEQVTSLFVQAQAAMPAGRRWPYLELGLLFAKALTSNSDDHLQALLEFSQTHRIDDPPLAARTLFCSGCVLRKRGLPGKALEVLEDALSLAEPLKSTSIVRDVLLHISRIHETMGNNDAAFGAFKSYTDYAMKGLTMVDGYRSFGFHVPQAQTGDVPDQPPVGEKLRNLEPAILRNAIRFISQFAETRISVVDVVQHCGVSRRTLENAFKQYRASTIAQCIKQAKMERAEQHLLNTNLPIRQVAACLGYASPTVFAKDFRGHFGKTPLKWRTELRLDP